MYDWISFDGIAVRDTAGFGTVLGRQPLAEFVDRDAELAIHALGGREAVAAQVARRTVLREATRDPDRATRRIRRTPSSRRRTAVRAPRRRGTSTPPTATLSSVAAWAYEPMEVAINTRGPPCAPARADCHNSASDSIRLRQSG